MSSKDASLVRLEHPVIKPCSTAPSPLTRAQPALMKEIATQLRAEPRAAAKIPSSSRNRASPFHPKTPYAKFARR